MTREDQDAMAPTLEDVDHIHVFVADRAAAQAWYARVMGLTPVPALLGWAGGGGPLTLGNAQDTVHLALFERPREACRSTIALRTTAAGLLAWQRHLRQALGHEARLEDHGLSWSLYFGDPDGNPFEITTYDHAEAKVLLAKAGEAP